MIAAPIQDITGASPPDLLDAILALNNDHAAELSWLDAPRLAALIGRSFSARGIGHADAFLLAFDERADYDSPNYLWFRRRWDRFVYVDRVVVAPRVRGQGGARRLYGDLIGRAAAAGHARIGCEVNLNPPNPASDALHAALGFVEAGRGSGGQGKTVRYLVRPVSPDQSAEPPAGG